MNPFDEIAVEEAVRLKEAGIATEVVAVSLGVGPCQETLRTALAMGADRGILVETDAELQPLAVAKLLKAVCDEEQPELVILPASRRSTTTPTRPARCWPRCWAGRRPPSPRKVDDGRRQGHGHARDRRRPARPCQVTLPAVVTADLRLNEPRYATLPNIMKAKKKPLETVKPADLGVDVDAAPDHAARSPSRPSAGPVKVADVAELVERSSRTSEGDLEHEPFSSSRNTTTNAQGRPRATP